MNTKEKHHAFLQSDWWKELRKRRLEKNSTCYVCCSKYYLNIHHAGYKYFYKPGKTKALKDTYVLCSGCHFITHKIQKERGLKYEDTKKIIEDLRKEFRRSRKLFKQRDADFAFLNSI